jgi:hypothetical protein
VPSSWRHTVLSAALNALFIAANLAFATAFFGNGRHHKARLARAFSSSLAALVASLPFVFYIAVGFVVRRNGF